MKGSLLFRCARAIGWILLPFLAIGLILHFGASPFDSGEVEKMPQEFAVTPPPKSFPVTLKLEHADGTPAADGVVLFFAPHLATSEMDAQGVAHAEMTVAGELGFLAFAPGHALLEGRRTLTELSGADAIRLEPLPDAVIQPGEKIVVMPRTISLMDQHGRPLPNALLLAQPKDIRSAEPWIAFTDANGIAYFPDASAKAIRILAYAPGLPPRTSTLLTTLDLDVDQSSIAQKIPVCTLRIANLPPFGMLTWRRLDPNHTLPLVQVPANSELMLGPVPPGRYRLELGSRILDVVATPDMAVIDFSADASR